MNWSIKYNKQCQEWHPLSCPEIVDEKGIVVAQIPQFVNHPGEYDIAANWIAKTIVEAVNKKFEDDKRKDEEFQ